MFNVFVAKETNWWNIYVAMDDYYDRDAAKVLNRGL